MEYMKKKKFKIALAQMKLNKKIQRKIVKRFLKKQKRQLKKMQISYVFPNQLLQVIQLLPMNFKIYLKILKILLLKNYKRRQDFLKYISQLVIQKVKQLKNQEISITLVFLLMMMVKFLLMQEKFIFGKKKKLNLKLEINLQ